jgi:hypothetical protein
VPKVGDPVIWQPLSSYPPGPRVNWSVYARIYFVINDYRVEIKYVTHGITARATVSPQDELKFITEEEFQTGEILNA